MKLTINRRMKKKTKTKKKGKKKPDGSIVCWDHCTACGRSQNRFWVKNKKQFEKERAEKLLHCCTFCKGKLTSHMEGEDR